MARPRSVLALDFVPTSWLHLMKLIPRHDEHISDVRRRTCICVTDDAQRGLSRRPERQTFFLIMNREVQPHRMPLMCYGRQIRADPDSSPVWRSTVAHKPSSGSIRVATHEPSSSFCRFAQGFECLCRKVCADLRISIERVQRLQHLWLNSGADEQAIEC